jgi:hypothetical protein
MPETAKRHDLSHCIDTCHGCHDACLRAVRHLLTGGHPAEGAHLRLLLDCAQICHTSEDFMLRGSELHILTCGVCAEVCERCAEECEGRPDEPAMRECAEACRRCAESCAEMAVHPARGASRPS